MKYILFILTFLIVVTSCNDDLEILEKPDNLIPRSEFKKVLAEMMVMESHVQKTYGNITQYYNVMKNSGQEIFDKYDLDSTQFSTSMDYYAHNQKDLKAIYTEIQDSLSLVLLKIENE